jgi:hypothetical protein
MRFLSIPNSSSELKNFARWFDQDFDLLDGDANNFAIEYFSSLSVEKRQALKSEMKKLLKEYPGKKKRSKKRVVSARSSMVGSETRSTGII